MNTDLKERGPEGGITNLIICEYPCKSVSQSKSNLFLFVDQRQLFGRCANTQGVQHNITYALYFCPFSIIPSNFSLGL